MIWSLLLTSLCGAAYEAGCVFWVHHSEQGQPARASLWSMFNALVTCIGLGEAIHRPIFIAAYAIGFGGGTFVAVVIKAGSRQRSR